MADDTTASGSSDGDEDGLVGGPADDQDADDGDDDTGPDDNTIGDKPADTPSS